MKESLINSGLDEQSATDKAYTNILPELQKELENIYMERLLWMKQLKKDPVHRKIMQTKDSLVENDDFDPEEAVEAAIDKRKFLIKRLLKDYDFHEGIMKKVVKLGQANWNGSHGWKSFYEQNVLSCTLPIRYGSVTTMLSL